MRKTIKPSNRGLCFSADDERLIGKPFRYVIDAENSQVLIIPNEGTGTISRKKSGKKYKPLFDLRAKEVKALVSSASYMEVEECESVIYVHVYKKVTALKSIFSDKIIRIDDVLASKCGEIVLDKAVNADYIGYDLGHATTHDHGSSIQTVFDVVSLFSGAGLLDYSFRDPQFRFVYAVDFSKSACETYRYNIGPHIECKDVREVEKVPGADLVIGGPCCQGFSSANRSNLASDTSKAKRELIDEYIRLVKSSKPKVFVIENVPQFMTMEQGRYFAKVTEGLSDRYDITATVVTDSDVGGYSTRRRAIVIGSRIGRIVLPQTTLHTVKTVRDALSKVDSSWFNFEDVTEPSENTKKLMSYVPQGGNWKDIPKTVREFGNATQSNVYRRLAWDEPSVTLTNWRKCNLLHPVENRILSVAEACAIMGLDKDFRVFGNRDERQQAVGNGVTQAIGRFVKEHVLKALNSNVNTLAFG